jgi:large subunit ribosomal protein L31
MKSDIHPKTHPVLFVDGDHEWTGVSTLKTAETRTVDGVEYYVVNLDISSFTHPFYTGQKKIVDSAGRVEKFMRRYANAPQGGAKKQK